MKNGSCLPFLTTLAVSLCMTAVNSWGVIVAGANGAGVSNTTGAELNAAVGGDFPYYENIIQIGSASGTYLGEADGSGWIMTAKHVSVPSSISISGTNYAVDSTFDVSGADLRVARIQLGPVAPGLPSVSIGNSIGIGTQTVMAGYGRNRAEAAATKKNKSDAVDVGGGLEGYTWTTDRQKRWGLNVVDASPSSYFGIQGGQSVTAVPGVGNGFFTTFDEPTRNFLNTNEAQASNGDSGGGVFTRDAAGNWQLIGVMSQIFTDPWQTSGTAGFTNQTVSVYVPDYESELAMLGSLGTPVPEPSAPLLVAAGLLVLTASRRRAA